MITSDQNPWRNTPMIESCKRQTVSDSQSKFTHVDAIPYFAHWNLSRRASKIFSKKYESGVSGSIFAEDLRLKLVLVLVNNLNPQQQLC